MDGYARESRGFSHVLGDEVPCKATLPMYVVCFWTCTKYCKLCCESE